MVKELLLSNGFWVLNKLIVKEYGIETALILTVMAEAESMLADDEGWFYQTAETIEEMTGLSNHKQTLAIKQLIKLGVLEQKNKGIPMKRYFKLNFETIENQVFKKFENYNSKNLKTSIQNFSNNKELTNKELNKKNNISVDKPHTHKFYQPSIDEVKAYCRERNKGLDAEKWYDFYEAKGWMIGKNKMKDWKAAVRTWEKNNSSQPKEEFKVKMFEF
jgi:hypothetical protein